MRATSFCSASEMIEIEPCPARELLDRVEAGHVQHAVHVAAILLAARRGSFPA